MEDAINAVIFRCAGKLPLPKKQLIPVRKPVKWIKLALCDEEDAAK